MSNNLIRPTNNAGVTIPQYQPGAMGQQQQYGQQTIQNNPISNVNNFFQHGGQQNARMINWEAGAAAGYQDPYLAELSEAAKLGADGSVEMLVRHKVSQAVEFYARSLGQKQGILYDVHMNTIKSFKIDKYTRQECPIHSKFIDTITRNIQYMNMVIRNSAAFFGFKLVGIVRKSNSLDADSSPFNQNNLSAATEHATRTVLFLEMVNWLDKSKQGREYAFNLPASIKEALLNLENIREFSNKVFAYFDAVSPYMELSFSKPSPEAYSIINPALMENVFEDNPSTTCFRLPTGKVEDWLNYEADRYAKDAPIQPKSVNTYSDELTWGRKTPEIDLTRLSRDNIHQYDFKKYFHPVPGLDNHYIIDPNQWACIERLYTNNPVGVWENAVVVVQANIDALNQGGMVEYEAKLCKVPKGVNVSQALTDPEKILPVLKLDKDQDLVVVEISEDKATKAIEEKKSPEVIPEVSEVGSVNKLIVVPTKDKIFSANVDTVLEESDVIAQALTGNKLNTASVITIEGKANFTVNDPDEVAYIKETYADLFLSKTRPQNLSWYKLMGVLKRLTRDNDVSEGVANFLKMCTTQQLNSVLSGCYGFDLNRDEPTFLKLDDIIDDFEDFVEYARENSTQLFEDMHSLEDNPLLANSYVLIDDLLVNAKSMPDSTILKQRSLYLGREFVLYSINSTITPKFKPNTKTNVNRSFFPSLFTTLDNVTDINKGVLLRFNNEERLWLVQRSALTEDFMTLRVLKANSTLPWTEFA